MSSCHIALFRPLRLRRLSLSLALALGCTVAVHAQAPAGAAATPGPAAAGAAHVQLWHAAARDAIARTKPNQQAALRLLAYLSLAQSEAAQAVQATAVTTADAAWNAAFDGASAELLSSLAPTQKPVWEGLAASLATARGEDDPSVAAAFTAARTAATEAARRVAARAAADGFNETWKGTAPESANAWRSQLQPARPPHLPQLAHMKPIFVASADALGAPPPPQPGDAKFASDLAEVRARAGSAGAAGLARAKRWEMTSGCWWRDSGTRQPSSWRGAKAFPVPIRREHWHW